jgi:hypothetical protein
VRRGDEFLRLWNPEHGTITLTMRCTKAQEQPGQGDALDTVKRYVELRLGGATWTAFAGLIAWDDEPGWDCNRVTDGYSVGAPEDKGSAVIVPVTYHRLGLYLP